MGHPPLRDAALIVNGNQNTADFCSALPAPIARPIGPNTALAFVLTIGPVTRFRCSKKIANYLGPNPSEDSSGGKRRLGAISKQGNTLLIETVHHAARQDPELRQDYQRVSSPLLLFHNEQISFLLTGYPPTHSFLLSISIGATLGTRFLLARQC